jgi:protein-arginine kinase activator protein McsA
MKKNMPTGVVRVRLAICERCAAQCADYLHDRISHADPCASCPAAPPSWGQYGRCGNFGLGDAVAAVAQPIAGAIDRVFGTDIKHCGGCQKRRETLNRIVPNL